MTVSYNKKATDFESLKTELLAEFQRRNKNGSLADLAYSSSQASSNNVIRGGLVLT